MKKIISLLCVCVLCLGIVGCSKNKTNKELSPIGFTEQQKIEDYNFYWDTMNELYPYWGELKDKGIDKDAIYTKYLKLVKSSKNDCEFLNLLFKFFNAELGKYHYGHLHFWTPEQYFMAVDTYKNLSHREAWKNLLINPVSQKTYKLFKSNEKNEFEPSAINENKEEKSNGDTIPINPSKKFSTDIINDKKTGYICIPSFNGLLIETEVPQVQKFINDNNKLSDIIIDIRGNSGGSDYYWSSGVVSPNIYETKKCSKYYLYNDSLLKNEMSKPYIDEIHNDLNYKGLPINELPIFYNLSNYANNFKYFTLTTQQVPVIPSETPYKGKIWVLGDSENYSAASGFLDFCKQNKFATIVGEASGGNNPNGDPALFAMPNSGIVFSFDLFYGLNEDGSCNAVSGTKPDVECSSKDALDVCIKKINQNK